MSQRQGMSTRAGLSRGDASKEAQPTAQPSTAPASVHAAGIAAVRAAWEVAKPERPHITEVTQLLEARREEGEGPIFERGPHVQATHFGFFKPERTAFLQALQLRNKDLRSTNEWEYINAAATWCYMASTAMIIAKS